MFVFASYPSILTPVLVVGENQEDGSGGGTGAPSPGGGTGASGRGSTTASSTGDSSTSTSGRKAPPVFGHAVSQVKSSHAKSTKLGFTGLGGGYSSGLYPRFWFRQLCCQNVSDGDGGAEVGVCTRGCHVLMFSCCCSCWWLLGFSFRAQVSFISRRNFTSSPLSLFLRFAFVDPKHKHQPHRRGVAWKP